MTDVLDPADVEDLTVVGTIAIPTEITVEDLRNISITACEGGIGYWSQISRGAFRTDPFSYQHEPKFELMPASGAPTWVGELGKEGEGLPTPLVVDRDTLLHGLQLYCEGHWYSNGFIRQHAPREVLEDLDSEAADVIVQLGLFGEVVYG